jgi:hypothetical protein
LNHEKHEDHKVVGRLNRANKSFVLCHLGVFVVNRSSNGLQMIFIRNHFLTPMRIAAFVVAIASSALAEERSQSFDADPQWDGRNNRATVPEPQLVTQRFGYSKTQHAGGTSAGEIGGLLTPAAEPTYYARPIRTHTFNDRLTASGKFRCTDRHFHVLVGFFNASSVNEWRVPNSVLLRLYGRGDVFYAYVEYCTRKWRAGADSPGGFATIPEPETGKPQLRGFASDSEHTWSLVYDPTGNDGRGSVTATVDGETAVCHLDPGHKEDGAAFNRFGVLNIPKHFDQGGEVWFDDLAVNGERESFDADPKWDAVGTNRTYRTFSVRPRFDFGFSKTNYAGGKGAGELGGEIFRGDCLYPERMAYYGDRVDSLTLDEPLRASGRVGMRRGISDSTTLLGFFNSKHSVAVAKKAPVTGFPVNFLGVAIEGPSREGFLFYPVYHVPQADPAYASGADVPHIMPDGKSREWSLEYRPPSGGRPGHVRAALGGRAGSIEVAELPQNSVEFDRFGIVTTWIDGNSQRVYFDDLTYTSRQ